MDQTFPVDQQKCWQQILNHPIAVDQKLPAMFIDRDGVLIEERHYLKNPNEVKLLPGAASLVKLANSLNIAVVIITNQGGIGRQFFGWSDFNAVQERIHDDLAKTGAFVNAVYACPHHGKGVAPYDQGDHMDRKPNPGMILKAVEALNIDINRSWMIGDKASDIIAAEKAKLKGGVHVLTGHGNDKGERSSAKKLKSAGFQVHCQDNIEDGKSIIGLFS